eukprot:364845-Chlamydomonas_euryale.AAC.3
MQCTQPLAPLEMHAKVFRMPISAAFCVGRGPQFDCGSDSIVLVAGCGLTVGVTAWCCKQGL